MKQQLKTRHDITNWTIGYLYDEHKVLRDIDLKNLKIIDIVEIVCNAIELYKEQTNFLP